MSDSQCPHLFVYGTLMSTAAGVLGRDMRLKLRREARIVGPATIHGQLYDLGNYPGFVASGAGTDLVHGELLELADPAATWPWLDAYEGIGTSQATPAEYARRIVLARTASDQACNAWVYMMTRAGQGLPRIRSGRWRAPR